MTDEIMRKYMQPRWERHLARFWSKVEKGDGCWLWCGTIARHPDGFWYGLFAVWGRNIPAHRFSYEINVGPIPEGLVVDHLCNTTMCVRPDHLEAKTQRANVLRGRSLHAQNARKTHCDNGHEFDLLNTYRAPSRPDKRMCRTCMNDRSVRYKREGRYKVAR